MVLFPEGTRFSPSRQARRLERMAERQDAMLEEARALRHTLPLHTGGAMALIAAAPDADIAFCAHTGLEGVQSFAQIPAFVSRRSRALSLISPMLCITTRAPEKASEPKTLTTSTAVSNVLSKM